jgi:hypothetical protein
VPGFAEAAFAELAHQLVIRERPHTRPQQKRLVAEPVPERSPLTPQQRLLILDAWVRSGLPAGDFAALVRGRAAARQTRAELRQILAEESNRTNARYLKPKEECT